ncbi:Collagen alpha-3(VI) chain [Bagarius yarrelli]|uniref:Collagen alpha-3(VI) chain n=1 Tax=Bagarius yarrelli TaxID=175774 RepID=A0A556UZ66_BAGYA|nr:Collagen alpha-3(VI) chain [Bagarius yarrelli]
MGTHWVMLCTLMGALLFSSLPKFNAQEAQDSADLVLLIDGSENVGAANFPFVCDLALRMIEGIGVGRDKIRVALVLYGADQMIQFELSDNYNKGDMQTIVQSLKFPGGYDSNLGAALDLVNERLLGPESGGRAEEGVPQAVVIISAGQSTDDVSEGERALKQANVIIFGVALSDSASAQLQTIASDRSFVLSAPDVSSGVMLGDQLLPYINGVAQRTIVIKTDITELPVSERDIIFLIDSSMGPTLVNAIREFIKKFIDTMPIGPDQVQIGVTMFGNTPKLEIDLNSHSTKESLISALARIKPKQSTDINTGAALEFVRTNMLIPEKGSRIQEGVPQLVLLISSKKSKDSVQQPAEALQQMGVLTIAAGSRAAEETELQQIAFDKNLVFMFKDFRQLQRNPKQIVSALSTLSGVVLPTDPVTETTTVQVHRVTRDFVFLVDGSNYVGNANMPAVKDFISRIVNHLDVRPERVRIGLIQFAEGQRTVFYLNSHDNKQKVLDNIAQLRLIGGNAVNTGAALQYALANHFQESVGSRGRQGVQQVLVLITGGPSQDEFGSIADQLALSGVLTFVVGVGPVDESELKKIAFAETLAYYENSFSDLPSLVETIITPLITVIGEPVTSPPIVDRGERDVAFLIDGSDAVRGDFSYIRDFIIKVIEPLDVAFDKVRISVVQHSERPNSNFYLNTYRTKDEVLNALRQLSPVGGRSLNTGVALTYMKNTILSSKNGGRAAQNVPQFLIVLTGGRSRDSVKEPAGALKTEGVVPFGIGVKNADSKQIAAISHNPSFAFNVKEFSQLNTVQQKLNTYVSLPKTQLEVILEQANVWKKDVVFLIDGSENTKHSFSNIQNFIMLLAESLSLGQNRDQISVVQYSENTTVDFFLNTHHLRHEVIESINHLHHKGGEVIYTGAALQYVKDNVFTVQSGSRRLGGVPQILILLSAGRSMDDVRAPVKALKEIGVFPLIIGTSNADMLELQTISYQPDYIFIVNFDNLFTIKEAVSFLLKEISNKQATSISSDFAKKNQSEDLKRDIAFLVDGSDNTRGRFEALRDFLYNIIADITVGENENRIAIIQYSNVAVANFHLNSFLKKEDVLNAVKGLTHKGGRPLNTGSALWFVNENIFVEKSGSRKHEGVAQILILLSGGKSKDNIDEPVTALKHAGVSIIGIGAQNSDAKELQKMSDKITSFFVDDYKYLSNIKERVIEAVKKNLTNEMTKHELLNGKTAKKHDITFLLDGSDGSRIYFPAMRNFVQSTVEKLNVSEERDHVSVVQFSRDPDVHFYLNTYTTKKGVLNMVRGLRHKGGMPLNIGAALQYVRDNVFTASTGSRRLEGVPQILILLFAGRSFDNVEIPASALKDLGIFIFAIGLRESGSNDLERMSIYNSFTMKLSNFKELLNVQEPLLNSLNAVEVPMTKPSANSSVGSQVPRRDIVFLLDGSDSNRNGFPAMRDFVQRLVERLNIGKNKDHVSVVQFSRDAYIHFYLNTYTTKEEIVGSVRSLRYQGGMPLNIGAALQYVRDNVFAASSGSRRLEGIPQMLILITGGKSNDNIDIPASILKNLGILIFGIGSMDSDNSELERISFDPSYALTVSDFTKFPDIQEQLLNSLDAVAVPMIKPSPASPVDYEVSRKDVVFLLDGSDGSRNGFPAMIDFVLRLVENFNFEDSMDRVAIVQYSTNAVVHFYLNTYSTRHKILNAIKTVKHKGGRHVNTGSALQYVRENVFTDSAGSRHQQGVPNILILLRGSRSTDNVDQPASALKEGGVLIFGVGPKNLSSEMERIANGPFYAQTVSELSDLGSVQQQFYTSLRSALLDTMPVIPTVRADQRFDRKDVVFLLDGSDGTKNYFPAMRDFIQNVVGRLNVSEERDHVSVVQFSRDPDVHFYLNTYTTKESVLNNVRGLSHKGGRPLNTGMALQYVRDNIFITASGSRRLQGVPQVLILLSGGRSFDNVEVPSTSLRETGVLIFSVGSGDSDSSELQKISSDPNFTLSVADFTYLPNVQEQLLSVITSSLTGTTSIFPTTIVESHVPRRDIVFLLDGSNSNRNGFPATRDFVQRLVERLNIGKNKDHVSVVQFSRDAYIHFYLNTYTTKEDIVGAVKSLRHKGGMPLNIGAALQYVRDNVFKYRLLGCSRRLEGVPQMLILMSGGRSNDNIDIPASILKNLGILIFGIGSMDSDNSELERISFDPSYALTVSDFTKFPDIQEQLLNSLDAVAVPMIKPSPASPVDYEVSRKDVVFLLDGSDGSRNGFPAMIDFVLRLVENFNFEDSMDRVAIVQYSTNAVVHFYLNTYSTRDEILNAIKTVKHKGGRHVHTGSALQYVRENVFTDSAGSRHQQGVPNILILLRGSRSTDNVDQPASALKESGVLIFGVGPKNLSSEMERIANGPSYAQTVSELSDLGSVQQQFYTSLRSALLDTMPVMIPTVRADQRFDRKDVVFLLDGSDGTKNYFPAMRDFIQNVVGRLNVSEERDHVSVVQFSRDPDVHFYLNTYTTKESVLNNVRGLSHKGGRPLNTGMALQYVRDNIFITASGSRRLQGVPQVLILLSGGRSFDNVEVPSTSLRETVADFTYLPNVQEQLLSVITSSLTGTTSIFPTTIDFTKFPDIQEQLLNSLDAVAVPMIKPSPASPVDYEVSRKDVVFLLDGSDGSRNGFPAMIDFVLRLVENFNFEDSMDRVAIVQYSTNAVVHFYLNTYSTRDEILNAIKTVKHKGGRHVNTGSALQYVRENVFTDSAGSRHQQGIPNILILLRGSRSTDNVDQPASALKESGVLIFGVGPKNLSSEKKWRELQMGLPMLRLFLSSLT